MKPSHATAGAIPAEIRYHVPSPDLIMMGCRPFEATPAPCPECGGRSRRCTNCGGRGSAEAGPCPVCEGRPVDRADLAGPSERPTVVYCLRCDAMDDRHDERLARQRVEVEVTLAARDREAAAALKVEHARAKAKRAELSESMRRRIFMGYRKGNPFAAAEPSGLAAVGRAWLAEIGQMPDWRLILDRRGRVVGRYEQAPAEWVGDGETHGEGGADAA